MASRRWKQRLAKFRKHDQALPEERALLDQLEVLRGGPLAILNRWGQLLGQFQFIYMLMRPAGSQTGVMWMTWDQLQQEVAQERARLKQEVEDNRGAFI